MCYSRENRERGFTLIELLIAMALALVVIGALSGAFVSQRKAFNTQEQVSEMIQGARAAMDMISREVKMAGFAPTGYDESATGPTPPKMQRKDSTAASFVGIPYDTTKLKIIADLNGDGETDGIASDDDANEEIIYEYDSTDKQIDRRTGSGTPQPMAENINSFTFEYYDGTGSTTTNVANIRQIEIIITARTADPDPNYTHPVNGNGYRTYTLASRVTPPNLGF